MGNANPADFERRSTGWKYGVGFVAGVIVTLAVMLVLWPSAPSTDGAAASSGPHTATNVTSRDATLTGPLPNEPNPANQAAAAQLNRTLPEVRFDNIAFADVLDFLRDVTNANIFVNWRAVEAAGIDRNSPVNARLRDVKFSKALETVLRDVGSGKGKLGYVVDEGVITISTESDLQASAVPSTRPQAQ
jgi:hypothetical protein